MSLKTIIVDDEPLAISLLSSILEDIDDIDIVATCTNGGEAIKSVLTHEADLLFLDIQMPGMNGFDVIRTLQNDLFPMVIFTTAFADYAVKAFEVNAIDYVLKPLDETRIEQAVRKALQQQQYSRSNQNRKPDFVRVLEGISSQVGDDIQQQKRPDGSDTPAQPGDLCIAVKDQGKVTLVLKSAIRWVEAAGDYVCIHTDQDTHMMRSTMKEVEGKLDPASFSRVHRSTIINHTRVREISPLPKGEAIVSLDNDEMVKVSRNYRDTLRRIIEQ